MINNENIQYRVSVLIFIQDEHDRHLLLHRNKAPNKGCWTPIGGKLEMAEGESPFECAVRETKEETGMTIEVKDLHLFSMIAEKSYEGSCHWLLFLFNCKKRITELPVAIAEGRFAFYDRTQINSLDLPETDRKGLWATYDAHREGFVAMRANCDPERDLEIIVEECH